MELVPTPQEKDESLNSRGTVMSINKYPLGRQRVGYKGETSQVPRPKEASNLVEET